MPIVNQMVAERDDPAASSARYAGLVVSDLIIPAGRYHIGS